MPIIDMHAHVWPDHLAGRVVSTITEYDVQGDGTLKGLAAEQAASGIDYSCCLFFALAPAQVSRVNDFARSLDRSRFLPFGTVHPDLSIDENLLGLQNSAAVGVKMHPTYQNYRLDDPRIFALLDALSGNYPVALHVGAGAGGDGSAASPRMVRDIIHAFPTLTLIACHFGGYRMLDESIDALIGEDVYFETSWPPSVAAMDPQVVRAVINRHGADKIVFGSDWPTASPAAELNAIRALGLTDEDTELILGGNAARILGR